MAARPTQKETSYQNVTRCTRLDPRARPSYGRLRDLAPEKPKPTAIDRVVNHAIGHPIDPVIDHAIGCVINHAISRAIDRSKQWPIFAAPAATLLAKPNHLAALAAASGSLR